MTIKLHAYILFLKDVISISSSPGPASQQFQVSDFVSLIIRFEFELHIYICINIYCYFYVTRSIIYRYLGLTVGGSIKEITD